MAIATFPECGVPFKVLAMTLYQLCIICHGLPFESTFIRWVDSGTKFPVSKSTKAEVM